MKDDEWNDETLKAFENAEQDNYIKKYMAVSKGALNVHKEREKLKKAEDYWNESAVEFKFGKYSETEGFLRVFCTGNSSAEKELAYIKDTGLLRKWCMEAAALGPRKAFPFKYLPENIRRVIGERCDNPKYIDMLGDV